MLQSTGKRGVLGSNAGELMAGTSFYPLACGSILLLVISSVDFRLGYSSLLSQRPASAPLGCKHHTVSGEASQTWGSDHSGSEIRPASLNMFKKFFKHLKYFFHLDLSSILHFKSGDEQLHKMGVTFQPGMILLQLQVSHLQIKAWDPWEVMAPDYKYMVCSHSN